MMRWERGAVREQTGAWPGVVRVDVEVGASETIRALAYTELTGAPLPGETVLLNTNALRRGLGTGGDALVVARPDALGTPPDADDADPGHDGHMMKARYTPMQVMVDAVDDPASEHYARMQAATSLEGMPVVAADLHSALPAIVAGIRMDAPSARIAYVLTDGAALPAWYSRTAATLREHGLLASCISAGQAFGGDLEAVSIPSALLAARHVVGADVAIAIQGPGNLGTGTAWGFSGVQAADALHAASVLGGRPIGALRVSETDPRERHRGLSHHSATTYGRLLHVPTAFALPAGPESTQLVHHHPDDSAFHASVREQLITSIMQPAAERGIEHSLVETDPTGVHAALSVLPVRLSTMGRGLDADTAAFTYAAGAGRAAARNL